MTKMIAEESSVGRNYFHEVSSSGCTDLLQRIESYIDERHQYLLIEVDDEGYQCVNIAAEKLEVQTAVEMIKYLVCFGADINAKHAVNGNTLMHTAVNQKNYELAKWLCQQENMNADSLNKEKKTPYEMAVINNDTEMMEILREHAATAFRNVNYLNIIITGTSLASNVGIRSLSHNCYEQMKYFKIYRLSTKQENFDVK